MILNFCRRTITDQASSAVSLAASVMYWPVSDQKLQVRQRPLSYQMPSSTALDRQRIIQAVADRRTVEQINNMSAVYEIGFVSSDRTKAAEIANAFASEYLAKQTEVKVSQLQRGVDWLTAQMGTTGEELVRLTQELESLPLRSPFADSESVEEAQGLRDQALQQLLTARSQGATGTVAELESSIASLNLQLEEHARYQAEQSRIQNEVTVTETMYFGLVERLSELREQGDLLRTDAQVISHARPAIYPSEPNRTLIALASALLTGLIAVGGVVFREASQRGMRSVSEFEEATLLPVVGFIPRSRRRVAPLNALVNGRETEERVAKSARKLRASLAATGVPHQIVAVASSLPGEGKSTLTLALAQAFSEAGERTLLLDLDFWRSPYVKWVSQTSASLEDFVTDPSLLGSHLSSIGADGLQILPARCASGKPRDLIASSEFGSFVEILRNRYDRILLDMPPTLATLDFASVASMADISLFVVRWNSTPRSAAKSALGALADVGVSPIGVVAAQVNGSHARAYSDDAFAYAHDRYISGY